MGRKSLATERIDQILDAFERAIVRYGLEHSTLEVIANEADMRRSMLHHYVGNVDALLKALIKRTIEREKHEVQRAFSNLDDGQLLEALLDVVVPRDLSQDMFSANVLITHLWLRQTREPYVKEMLDELYRNLQQEMEGLLERLYPQSLPQYRQELSYTLLCLSEGYYTTAILPLGSHQAETIRRAAQNLIYQLHKPMNEPMRRD